VSSDCTVIRPGRLSQHLLSPVLFKCFWRLADFDGDHFLGKEDLEQVINAITRNAMTADEVSYIYSKVGLRTILLGPVC